MFEYMEMAKIFFLMWVSWSGKTTVLESSGLLDDPTFLYVQSYTTRPLREGETQGEKYRHISKEEFEQALAAGEFLEHAVVHESYYYGSKYASLVEPLEKWIHTIKEIDMSGLIDIQDSGMIDGKYCTVFLDIPQETMRERITWRGLVSWEELEQRLASAAFEREEAATRCDHIIDASQPLEKVVENVIHIIRSET